MGDPHIVLSDDDEDDDPLLSPIRFYDQPKKKSRIEPEPNPNPNSKPIANPNPSSYSKQIEKSTVAPSVVLIDDDDDDLIPQKRGPISAPKPVFSAAKFSDSGVGFISLDSDNESEGGLNLETGRQNKTADTGFETSQDFYFLSSNPVSTSTFSGQTEYGTNMSQEFSFGSTPSQDDTPQDETGKNNNCREATRRKKMTEEEKSRLKEEKMGKLLQEKQRKQALKAEAAELRKAEREKKKWENGKTALKSIVAEIDAKVIEMGSVGGNLLTRFSEKGVNFRIASNPINQSILWTMKVPEHMNEIAGDGLEIRYVLLVYQAEEFCNMITNNSLFNDIFKVQSRYPSHTVCILTNKLKTYVDKKEQEQYKNRSVNNNWRRPPIEEVFAKLTTHFNKVHSRQCTDEAELAEHVVGLTFSLASCQFRKKLTRLSVNANGSAIPKDSTDKNLIKNNLWLKVLVAIPKVQPRYAVAIWKKYPTMKSLLRVYMDPCKSVHEKEFLLKDLKTEGLLGDDRRLGEVCSRRVYRILCAKNGSIKTDDIEDGADFF